MGATMIVKCSSRTSFPQISSDTNPKCPPMGADACDGGL